LETTGLDRVADRPTEVGAILYTSTFKRTLESMAYLVRGDVPITPRITELTGINQPMLDKFGYDSKDALEAWLDLANQSDAIAGQNVRRFDKPFFENWCLREGLLMPQKLWIDTRYDLVGVESKHLGYMAADAGFLNLFPHSALSDCQTVLKLIELQPSLDAVVARAQSPETVLIAVVSFEDRQKAKDRKYSWNGGYRIWWKLVKEMDLQGEVEAAPFDCAKAGAEISLDKLLYE
jgi:DNA polymerase III epsilon subunit-like protein